MQKSEIIKILKKLLEDLEMSSEDFYNKKAAESDYVKNHMKPSDMMAYRCSKVQAEIEWILTH